MKKICIIGFFLVSLLGVLFHFAYDYIPIFIFPKNESIFEHTKLVIVPMVLYLLGLMFCKIPNKKEIFCSFISSILIGNMIVVSGYYTYSGILGFDVDWVNISIYLISVLFMFIYIYKKKTLFGFSNSVVIMIILIINILVFTYYPLDISFFKNNN